MYNGSDWVPAEAQIYKNGSWSGFELLLYDAGIFYNTTIIPILNNGCTYEATYILVPHLQGSNACGIYTQSQIPSGYSQVHILASSDIGGSYTVTAQYGQNELTASLPSIIMTGAGRVSYESQAISGTKMEITIQMTGPYGFFIGTPDSLRSLIVYKIWLT